MKKPIKIFLYSIAGFFLSIGIFLLGIAYLPLLYDTYIENSPGINNFSQYEKDYQILADFMNKDLKARKGQGSSYFISWESAYSETSECVKEDCTIPATGKNVAAYMDAMSIRSIFHYPDDRIEFTLNKKITMPGTVYLYDKNGFSENSMGQALRLKSLENSYVEKVLDKYWAIVEKPL